MTTYLLIIISQLFWGTSCEKENIEPANLSKKIEKKVLKIAKEKNIPSLEATITNGEDIIDFKYNHKEVKKQDIYGIGSTTKFLSSVLIFKLIEDKKLRIDSKVIDFVNLARPITGIENLTIKNLLNHTSGLSDYTKHPDWMKNLMNNNAPKTFEEKILLVSNTLENNGSFSYSNTNYLFLQKIVETITATSYDVAFNNFYSTNNLSNIKMGFDENRLQAFFGQTEQASSDVSVWREYYGFDGGAFTDTNTLDNFLAKLFRDKSILKSSTISEMEEWIKMEPMTIPIGSGIISEYGSGIMKLTYNGQEYIGHFGGTLKYQSMTFYNSKKDIAISIATNCSGRHFNNVFFQELIPAILDEL
ncbi:serine hydrolase domain-containing protein [Flavivirga algicola]|uniref:Beta-lactamase family protein n=1 Tax=Flavivirga algicola TaxID=2729136 RepID=A0ABX1S185_9FLAO|nr:serine hydrolase domain-containing protein [Flavivirga algicola]NMH89591.1 beta-lactamase family protein [Flavivirga algicola]